jgi:hypothetical protein
LKYHKDSSDLGKFCGGHEFTISEIDPLNGNVIALFADTAIREKLPKGVWITRNKINRDY